MIVKGSKDGLHIRFTNRRTDGYAVYELWNGDDFIVSAHGGCALMTLALTAEQLDQKKRKFTMADALVWVVTETGPLMENPQWAENHQT